MFSVPDIWLPLSHADSISSLSHFQLVALCDADPNQLRRAGSKYPDCKGYTDYREMLRVETPSIVGIATRADIRAELITNCIESGVKGIHAEKPLARSLGDCKSVLSSIDASGVKLTYGTVRRLMAPYKIAREVLDSGEIGTLRQVVIEHGSDMLMWGHPHSVDLAIYYHGNAEATGVRARLNVDRESYNHNLLDSDPTLVSAHIDFSDGTSTVITSGHGFNVRLFGDSGSITVVGDGSRLELRKKSRDRPYELTCSELEVPASMSGTQEAFCSLSEAIHANGDTDFGTEDILNNQKILFAMVLSELHQGIEVSPDNVPDDFTVTGKFGNLYA
jgi:predicted dehydrogenase